ncbi:MAG TPA: isoleucine--tRNA ligase [Candidatus Bipolaricaulota bacterium]|nr:isoleucine--tRNA ligase [Candidatus Bipolaricaulota bacterium]
MKFSADRKQFPEREVEIMEYWLKEKIFEESVNTRPESKPFVFFDGPPFATGLPHYGHIVPGTIKDIFPRYKTMQGFQVDRKWGWDCHGLPIENLVEKELKLKSKEDIEEYGIDKFCEKCREKVLMFSDEWKKIIARLGRWVDMDSGYKTMDPQFMESVWWGFKALHEKGLAYEGYRSMHICPRCETTLSNFEVSQGYMDVFDISVTCKFELEEKIDGLAAFVLAWTTTPWTLPGNVALAVGADMDYSIWKKQEVDGGAEELLILAQTAEPRVFGHYAEYSEGDKSFVFHETEANRDFKFEFIKKIRGAELENKKYVPLFDYFLSEELPNKENLYKIVSADFVSTEEGTGVVHIAPAFGEDDLNLGQEKNLSFIQHVTPNGKFIDQVREFSGQEVKPKGDPTKTDKEIVAFLAAQGNVFLFEDFEHSYPHCWRCDTPLLNYATSSWFVKVTDIKNEMIKMNDQINWMPEHLKQGRFGKWLENVRDWSISRARFWGNPIPVWKCVCGEKKVVGSIKELEELSGQKVTDLHKHFVDKIMFPCEKCGSAMQRVPEVFDCWMESGSVPFARMHYPFENEEYFKNHFPADFIAEGQDQTRGWFYTLLVLSTALFDQPAFKNVVVNGMVLAEDGQKMAKSKKNYPDLMAVVDKYSADALRFYLMSSPVVRAEDLRFSEKGVDEVYKKVILLATNVLSFYLMYATEKPKIVSGENILDKWIFSKLNLMVKEVTENLNKYDLNRAQKSIQDFINELSTWYVRRSRERVKGDDLADKEAALSTLYQSLMTLSQTMAPFTPFLAEFIYDRIGGEKKSVHLEDWPLFDEKLIDQNVLSMMDKAKQVIEIGLAIRQRKGVKVRQALSELEIVDHKFKDEYSDLIKDELNVKKISVVSDLTYGGEWRTIEDAPVKVALNTEITPELEKEGLVREIIRSINNLRKGAGYSIEDRAKIYFETSEEDLREILTGEFGEEIKKKTLVDEIIEGKKELEDSACAQLKINGKEVWFGLEKN